MEVDRPAGRAGNQSAVWQTTGRYGGERLASQGAESTARIEAQGRTRPGTDPDCIPARKSGRPTVSVHALGCKANLEEMECLLSQLEDAGYEVVPFGRPADWTVVNTCTVTTAADSDSRQFLRRAQRAGGRVVATGCLAQRHPEALAAIDGVAWVVGNQEKPSLAQWILDADRGAPSTEDAPAVPRIRVDADPTLRTFASYGGGTEGRRTRATLKIQDGCDEHCTFCVIPQVRGASRSRPLDRTLEEARRLVGSGYREIALTGINTALWGRDLIPERSLPDLLDALATVPDLLRLRLNSLEPQYVEPSWIDRLARHPQLCRHLHLPLQSGDATVLKRMNRRYDPVRYAAVVESAVRAIPELAVGADVLVGFPGETDAQFESTRAFLASLPLAYLHVFSYSERPDTPAPRLGDEVPVEERKRRSSTLRQLGGALRRRYFERLRGTVQRVLPEGPAGDAHWQGLTDNYIRVRFPWTGSTPPPHRLLRVRIEPTGAATMSGTLIDDELQGDPSGAPSASEPVREGSPS
ncbi:MAG: tRNA (N(6)-L-threonylcarbamoyladenosine(37)-C(2))-methylthiotransferase MtaB [Candidatus Eisenbacteria bacterium]|uniref:tRNA (N(6)-L-threonylcarbamoyladenosine(37)-C(2))-methylthiotransferase MtaB n=1 Tax=Eiseniibacteriota bacterium TaxID=2212470 RepID=A0A956RN24_UNCEI|nr:tRNA (N(6)-L-threonylcarbamoyladenosine(37)-C(2))-methylthiotransferase MtaB [Candidatus Eisenbacteria bacterium]